MTAKPAASLTAREREVLRRIASSETVGEIGGDLGIAIGTVYHVRAALNRKLKVYGNDTAGLTRTAIKMGLVNL